MIKDIEEFLKRAINGLKDNPDATWYKELGNDLYLVVAYDEDEDEFVGKVAINSDDLQYDYEWDWTMPYYEDGECYFSELGLHEDDLSNAAKWFVGCYNEMKNWKIDERGLILSKEVENE